MAICVPADTRLYLQVSHTYEDFLDLSLSLRPEVEPKQRKRDRFFRLAERWAGVGGGNNSSSTSSSNALLAGDANNVNGAGGSGGAGLGRRSSTPGNGAAGTSFTALTAAAAVRAAEAAAAVRATEAAAAAGDALNGSAVAGAGDGTPLAVPPRPQSAYDARTMKPSANGLSRRVSQKVPSREHAAAGEESSDMEQHPVVAKPKGWVAWTGLGEDWKDRRRRRSVGVDATGAMFGQQNADGTDDEPVITKDRFFGLRKPSQKKSKKVKSKNTGATASAGPGLFFSCSWCPRYSAPAAIRTARTLAAADALRPP